MRKRERKILLIIMIIIILLMLAIILLMLYLNKKQTNNEEADLLSEYENTFYEIEEVETNSEIKLVDSYSQYYSILEIIEKYYESYIEKNSEVLYQTLDIQYIQENSITEENVLEKVNVENITTSNYFVKEMYIEETTSMFKYYVSGHLKELGANANTYFTIFVDQYNATYSICPISSDDYNNIVINKTSINKEEITPNSNNLYNVATINDTTILQNLLENYQYQIENNIQLAYEKLDNEYKEKKFSNIEEYSKYIDNIGIKQAKVTKYQRTNNDNYTQYVILDENGKYYIFRETAVMDYTVILDTYTIDLPEFVNQYNKLNNAEKVQYSIQRFFDAINDGDYKYAYSKLDETYKNNNFPTQVEFENYIKATFFTKNKLGYTFYENKGETYVYNVVITNYNNENEKIEKQFILKLLEGTEFVMSFEK